jgi:2-methylcitrate dehydratase PrpD
MAALVDAELGRFAAGLAWRDLPSATRARVLEIWVDAVANAIAGRRAATTHTVEHLARTLAGPGEATVVGGGTASMTGAALVNGLQITAFTMCDVYRPALCHVTPEVLPALLAVAEQRGTSGEQLMAALAVGLEVTVRLGRGIDYPRFRGYGWHAPGVIGTIGAAAAAARLLGLDDAGVGRAVGLGVSQAGGTFAALGTPAVKFHQARGAVSGLWAALFAAEGLGGSDRAISHPDGGLLCAFAGGGDPEAIVDGLGQRWELEQISLRRWPAASSLQSLVACLLAADDDGWDGVANVEVALPRTSYEMCAEMGWDDELSAMQSARFVTAAVLRERRCWIDLFDHTHRTDPELARFARDKVSVRRDPDLAASGAEIAVLRTGRPPVTARWETVPGEPTDPLPRALIRDKLVAACAVTPVASKVDRLTGLLLDVDRLPDVRELVRALRAAPVGGSLRERAGHR